MLLALLGRRRRSPKLLKQHGLVEQCHASSNSRRRRLVTNNNSISSSFIAVLKPDVQYERPLTPWNEECAYPWKVFSYLADAYSVRISKCVKISHSVAIATKRRLSSCLVWLPELTPSCGSLQGKLCSAIGEAAQLHDADQLPQVLGVTAEQWNQFIAAPLCFSVPDILLSLVERGAWSKLLLTASWCSQRGTPGLHRLCQELQFSSQQWLLMLRQAYRVGNLVPPILLPFGREHARSVAQQIRQLAPLILGEVPEGEDHSTKRLEREGFGSELRQLQHRFCEAS